MIEPQPQHWEHQYLELLHDIRYNGYDKPVYGHGNRTIRSVFGRQLRFDLSKAFPLLTTKKMYWKGIVEELLWFMRGETNITPLVKNNVHIWDEWAYKRYLRWHKTTYQDGVMPLSQDELIARIATDDDYTAFGELGAVYGRQWRKWVDSSGRVIDQLGWALWKLQQPSQRERKHIVVSAWNPEFIYEMALPGNAAELPPCHMLFQFNVQGDKLSCMLFQRSADNFLGEPYNMASYALLTHIMARLSGLKVGELVVSMGDAHLYDNHFEAVAIQLQRKPLESAQISISDRTDLTLNNITADDIILSGYTSHPRIQADITAVGGYDESNDYKGG